MAGLGLLLAVTSVPAPMVVLALGLAGLGLLTAAYAVRQTTLLAAVIWGWATVAILLLWAAAGAVDEPLLRYLAATLSLTPAIAVLGAKRPQHHAWQFIVSTLWLVLSLPAAEGLLYGSGRMPDLHVARQTMLCGLIAVEWTNYIATRGGWAVTLLAAGQILLLAPQVSWLQWLNRPESGSWGCLLVAAAALAPWVRVIGLRGSQQNIHSAWLAFRDLYGAAWALRVADRLNETARQQQWPVELRWHGWCSLPSGTALEVLDPAWEQCCAALLRRFVTRGWLAKRQASGAAAID